VGAFIGPVSRVIKKKKRKGQGADILKENENRLWHPYHARLLKGVERFRNVVYNVAQKSTP
jgi:hypothetical protein